MGHGTGAKGHRKNQGERPGEDPGFDRGVWELPPLLPCCQPHSHQPLVQAECTLGASGDFKLPEVDRNLPLPSMLRGTSPLPPPLVPAAFPTALGAGEALEMLLHSPSGRQRAGLGWEAAMRRGGFPHTIQFPPEQVWEAAAAGVGLSEPSPCAAHMK